MLSPMQRRHRKEQRERVARAFAVCLKPEEIEYLWAYGLVQLVGDCAAYDSELVDDETLVARVRQRMGEAVEKARGEQGNRS